jgi:hypothetical protein
VYLEAIGRYAQLAIHQGFVRCGQGAQAVNIPGLGDEREGDEEEEEQKWLQNGYGFS